MSEIKPCPFCGSTPRLDITGSPAEWSGSISCPNPKCTASPSSYENGRGSGSAQEAVTRSWNTRAAPKVKALDWFPDREGRGLIAKTAVGQYAIFDDDDPRWAYHKSLSGYRYFKTETFEEARAAAQSHYEKLILEALE